MTDIEMIHVPIWKYRQVRVASILLLLSLLAGCGGAVDGGSTPVAVGNGGGTSPSTPKGNNEWTWVSGSNTVAPVLGQPGWNQERLGQEGIYGVEGTPAADSVPGSRSGSASWVDKDGNLWLFGGGGIDSVGHDGFLNDLWKFDTTRRTWIWMGGSNTVGSANSGHPGSYGTQGVASGSNIPGGRTFAAYWTDKNGDFWLFGGLGIDSTGQEGSLNDLWKFDPSEETWTWVNGSTTANQSGVYGSLGKSTDANMPGARGGASAWVDTQGNFWIYGGSGLASQGGGGYLNDLWRFNPSTGQWTWMSGSDLGNYPLPVYGTRGIAASENTPGGRQMAASWIDADGNLWLFGGTGMFKPSTGSAVFENFSDLWKYDPNTGEWTWEGGSNTPDALPAYGTFQVPAASNSPGNTYGAAAWKDARGSIWLFVGNFQYTITSSNQTLYESAYLNDFWRYDPMQQTWAWMSGGKLGPNGQVPAPDYGTLGIAAQSNTPGSRYGFVSWTDKQGNFWLFGGTGIDSVGYAGFLNDLWEFQPIAQ